MHTNAFTFVAQTVEIVTIPPGLIVEIGGRHINGSIRSLFRDPYLAIDLVDGPGVDVVADGATYLPETPPAVVVCCEVLEHAANADAICANAYQILQPGGIFIVTMATEGRAPHSAVDGGRLRDGEFYRNVSEAELRRWLARFVDVTIAFNRETADIYAVASK